VNTHWPMSSSPIPTMCGKHLSGDRKGLWSFRVNRQWRICFRWVEGDAFDVELVDCH
jgi:plasmid maintenance system killer protein